MHVCQHDQEGLNSCRPQIRGAVWVTAILCCLAASFMLPSVGDWLETSGTIHHLIVGLVYLGPVVLVLSLTCGVASRCPG